MMLARAVRFALWLKWRALARLLTLWRRILGVLLLGVSGWHKVWLLVTTCAR